jgi:hypothetical protein
VNCGIEGVLLVPVPLTGRFLLSKQADVTICFFAIGRGSWWIEIIKTVKRWILP